MEYIRDFGDSLPPLEPMCRHLRSKSMFVTGQMEPTLDSEVLEHSNCWCNHTQDVFGLDALVVDRRGCDATRTCYEQLL